MRTDSRHPCADPAGSGPIGRTVLRQAGRLFLLGCAWCVLPAPAALALDPARELTQYNCVTWTRQNGLPVNGVTSITQTRDGFIWMGTAAGPVRFDGVDFKLLDLSRVPHVRNSTVTTMAAAQNGGLWVGLLYSSFGFWDGNTFTLRGKDSWGGLDMNIRNLFENPDGTLWIAALRQGSKLTRTGGYEEVFGTSTRADVRTDIDILCGYQDSRGRLWFGTASAGVAYWEAGKTTAFPDASLVDVLVNAIAVDGEGQVWIGTNHTLLVDRHGLLWIGTNGRGVARYQAGAYTFIGKNDGLAGSFVTALFEDREGSMWIATHDGLSQLADVKFPIFRAAEDPAIKDACSVSASRRGGVWIGSPGGATYFDGQYKTYFTAAGVPESSVMRIFEARNGDAYLIGGRGARNLLRLSGGKVVATWTAPYMISSTTEDAEGIVVNSAGRLYRVGAAGLTPYVFKHGEPSMHWVLDLLLGRDGAIWVASERGIFRVKDGEFTSWAAAEGLTDIRVYGLCEDGDGVIWSWTVSGIARLKDGKIRIINRDNGLFDNNIYAIVPDDFGNLWVDSGRGIFRVTRKDMNDFADGKIPRIECTVFDGPNSVRIPDKTFQEHVGCKTADGRIWFPNPQGVVMIDPARVAMNRIEPPVHIDRVLANGHDLSAGTVVPPGRGELEVHFTALSFIVPQRIRFRYQLEGYDNDWVDAGDRRLAFYTNLKPGRYTFRVIGANADGVWNRTGDSLGIQLSPHFYQTAWFYVLCGGAVCGVVGGIYLQRMRHIRRRQRALQEARDNLEIEVRKRTAELAAANTSLKHEIEEHQHSETQLEQRTRSLENQIEERKTMQLEIDRAHQELLESSRMAGMAEVATGVLHNVGNVLNSVNVSATLIADHVRHSKTANLAKVCGLFDQHKEDVGAYLSSDPKGKMIPAYLGALAEGLAEERKMEMGELDNLRKNIEHIKDIVAMQQNYARNSGFTETVSIVDLVEDALRMNASSLARHDVDLVREYQARPVMSVDKHKVMQIVINLVRNAKYACDESNRIDKSITARITADERHVRIAIIDNGVGIPPENLTRIFSHGFTTRKQGHGFGLHSGALAARELGGTLTVFSEGPGRGAIFTLEIPCKPESPAHVESAL